MWSQQGPYFALGYLFKHCCLPPGTASSTTPSQGWASRNFLPTSRHPNFRPKKWGLHPRKYFCSYITRAGRLKKPATINFAPENFRSMGPDELRNGRLRLTRAIYGVLLVALLEEARTMVHETFMDGLHLERRAPPTPLLSHRRKK